MARGKDPLEPGVLSICKIEGGHAPNVIADRVEMQGTLRTFSEGARTRAQDMIVRVVDSIAQVHGCSGNAAFAQGAPTVLNDPGLHGLVVRAAEETLGSAAVEAVERPSTGAEDFGYFSHQVPTYMMRLGVRRPGAETHHLHTARFHADHGAIDVALTLMRRALIYALDS